MRRVVGLVVAASLAFPVAAVSHELDHPATGFSNGAPLASTVLSGGEDAEWELITSIPTGNPHTDLDFFTQDGVTYASVGTLAAGANGGGQTIVKLMDADGTVAPTFVSAHPSAQCASFPRSALGLQHDVEATPKGTAILNATNPFADTSDTQLLLDASDATGRCHDQNETTGGPGSPQGGLEIVDVTDIDNPVEIALTSHIGQAHTVNVDPKRPHIAYAVSSDSVSVDNNETPLDFSDDTREDSQDLDGWEMIDLSSCMNFPDGTTVEDKREDCRPLVFRYRYPTTEIGVGYGSQGTQYGCHELELYPEDVLACGGGTAGMLFDISSAFNDQGTPDDYSDDTLNGTPLPCTERATATSNPAFTTGATIIDCTATPDGDSLDNAGWEELGSPSISGIKHLGSAHHFGDRSGETAPAEDIQFNHETELTDSRRFIVATDERGGGVVPPDASCAADNSVNTAGNGGVHAYAVDRLDAIGDFPASMEEADEAYARTPDGDKSILRITPRAPGDTFCTAHVMQQIPGQNRIFMGWYTQGTQVIDFIEHPDGSFEFIERAFFIPENANTWVSHIFDVKDNGDGTFTYTGATGDFNLGTSGRSTIDVYRVTLPAPPMPAERVDIIDAPDTDTGTGTAGTVERLAGDDRFDTAVAISQDSYPDNGSASAVVLSRGDSPNGFADALSGGPLAVDRDAPLLLTDPDALRPEVLDEIERALPSGGTVYVLGGEDALSADVATAITDAGFTVERIFGETRYDTAVAIADELGNPDLTLLATGDIFPDALSASAAAAANGGAVILTPSETRGSQAVAYLDDHQPSRVVAVGGPAARPFPEAEQIIGSDRLATSVETAELLFDNPTVTGLARSDAFPDALAGGAHVAAQGGPLLLTPTDGLDSRVEDYLCDLGNLSLIQLYGGTTALAGAVSVDAAAVFDNAC